MNDREYDASVRAHAQLVAEELLGFSVELIRRGITHDATKFVEPERQGFMQIRPVLDRTDYLDETYEAALKSQDDAVKHHWSSNPHHPEYHDQGISGMTLSEIVEMMCDWYAASQRVPGTPFDLEKNIERFSIEPQLAAILRNTAETRGW